ncbi:MAG: MmgE/PrpD family protein [Vampirovibrionales bacterium]|nr:MmgE/PrpD family protein [Vampirovibrionales bacterium]
MSGITRKEAPSRKHPALLLGGGNSSRVNNDTPKGHTHKKHPVSGTQACFASPLILNEGFNIVAATQTTQTGKQTLLAHRLAEYADSLSYDNLPKEALQEAKRRIIDSLGCAIGAKDSDPARISRTVARLSESKDGATVIFTKHKSSVENAAFANGVLFRYLDFNDTYLSLEPAHPSDNIAAILAVAEAEGKNGKDILTAIVLAYEIQCRLCDAASIRARGWDHVTYGSFSAGLASGKLYGLDKTQLVHVQGLAATPNNAMRQTRVGELSNWKGCAFANASRNAVFAALLAKHGMTGPSEIFEGEMGFWKQISGEFELPTLGGVNGAAFMINKTYVKHFPAEYHSQSAIEAAFELRDQIVKHTGVKAPQDIDQHIESITIESFDAAVDIIAGFKEHWRPQSRETADHSMPYCVSAALMDGEITLDTFTQERIQDARLVDLIQKVKVNRNAKMTAGYPEGIPNLIVIKLADGKVFEKEVAYPLGHAKNPMQDSDIEHKFRTLAKRAFDEKQIQKQLDALWKIEDCQNIGDILKLFVLDEQ